MGTSGIGLEKYLISLPVILGAAALPAGVSQLFYIIFADFYSNGFLTGLPQFFICLVIMIINLLMGFFFAEKYWLAKNGGQDGKRVIRHFLVYLASGILVQIILNVIIENPFKDPPAPPFF
ncbi:hypothetical protein [Paenibacillus sp. MMS20-IR301]|uniref:hypothetical protein n=1 Tax=Paenibacillus sp. MMS20-IR301 TaxID=2895946 RepID=UPI0028EFCE1C|nr:hypothetical protein [Paenibacillus sp. MMS20-IR301]WNS46703.1 hypothetical protein LOS79_16065 [Paenibacillus sp. MMS20-IR301]